MITPIDILKIQMMGAIIVTAFWTAGFVAVSQHMSRWPSR